MSVLPTNRKILAAHTGWHTSFQRWMSWCLLLVYGIPACLGPHWHHHEDHPALAATCESDLQGEQVVASCDCCSEQFGGSDLSKSQTDEVVCLEGDKQLQAEHLCAICAYYALAIVLNRETSTASCSALQDFLAIDSDSPWLASILRANSRGPPAVRLSLNKTCLP